MTKAERNPKDESLSWRLARFRDWSFGFLSSLVIRHLAFCVAALLFSTSAVHAHIGSPDVFYEGMVGPYATRIVIRMPSVVPGRAEITASVRTSQPVEVSFLPVYAYTPVSNAPPADLGHLVGGESNIYSGELWLMSWGAYSIDVKVRGADGQGSVEIPVNSVATRQLPLPSWLGKVLVALAVVLVGGGLAIVSAAARESVVAPGAQPGSRERRKGIVAGLIAAVIFAAALAGGKKWWSVEERDFRRHLREGAWPDLVADARPEGAQRILRLELGRKDLPGESVLGLLPDHGKLLHLFLVREPGRDVFAHVHPVRKAGKSFETVLPSLPAGTYRLFCDLTLERSGLSSTATNLVEVPAVKENAGGTVLEADPDDSWAAMSAVPQTNSIFKLPDGGEVEWKRKQPLRTKEDASLRFEVRDAKGEPVELEPYMGMLCHAAVLRTDAGVFAHLHPAGNYSMAAQAFFEAKWQRESGGATEPAAAATMDHAEMGHAMHHHHAGTGVSSVYVPYEFPAPGGYRIWVQFKVDGRVVTALFDARVE